MLLCETCGAKATKRCAKCRGSMYCSAECQRAAYESHNGLCVWRRTRDVALREAIGNSCALHCINYFRMENNEVVRGQFEFKKGRTISDALTSESVVLHARNTENGKRAALLGVPCSTPGLTLWQPINVVGVFTDPEDWLNRTVESAVKKVLEARHLDHLGPSCLQASLSAQDAHLLGDVLPRLLDALKAHCCEEGEDDIKGGYS